MNVNQVQFVISAVKPQQYPTAALPEVAFAGRSNVGKSSILNTLVNRKNLARVGATPGKTREINFFNVENRLHLVDLPGYGYASVSKDRKAAWGESIETYLKFRQQLKLLVLLVDIRHAPSEDDRIMFDWMKQGNVPHAVVATKADKISRGQVKPRLQAIRTALGAGEETPIVPFSSETRQGRDEVWALIEERLGLKDPV